MASPPDIDTFVDIDHATDNGQLVFGVREGNLFQGHNDGDWLSYLRLNPHDGRVEIYINGKTVLQLNGDEYDGIHDPNHQLHFEGKKIYLETVGNDDIELIAGNEIYLKAAVATICPGIFRFGELKGLSSNSSNITNVNQINCKKINATEAAIGGTNLKNMLTNWVSKDNDTIPSGKTLSFGDTMDFTHINQNGVSVRYTDSGPDSYIYHDATLQARSIKFESNSDYMDYTTYLNSMGTFYSSYSGGICLMHGGYSIYQKNGTLYPGVNSSYDLGTSAYKFRNVYAANGTIQTSDRTKKSDITPLSDQLAKDFITGLSPSSYRMTDGTSGRRHWGLIAQDVEELMERLGMDSKDFAGLIKSPKIIASDADNTNDANNPPKTPVAEMVKGEYDYSLRYDEFIAPMINVIQDLNRRVEELEKSAQKN